jgi:hypothetical protein
MRSKHCCARVHWRGTINWSVGSEGKEARLLSLSLLRSALPPVFARCLQLHLPWNAFLLRSQLEAVSAAPNALHSSILHFVALQCGLLLAAAEDERADDGAAAAAKEFRRVLPDVLRDVSMADRVTPLMQAIQLMKALTSSGIEHALFLLETVRTH